MKNLKVKNLIYLIIGVFLIVFLTLIIIFSKNNKKKDFLEKNDFENSNMVEIGHSNLKSEDRYTKILDYLKKREQLIIEKDKLKENKNLKNSIIKKLEEEGIKVQTTEVINELKKQNLLLNDDQYIEEEKVLKIGKLGNNKYSFEIIIPSINEILEKEAIRVEKDRMIPYEEYLKLKGEKETTNKENTNRENLEKQETKTEIESNPEIKSENNTETETEKEID